MSNTSETFYVLPRERHNDLVRAIFVQRGYEKGESSDAAEIASDASWHGIRTHNAIKALELESKHRTGGGGSKPGAKIRRIPGRFAAAEVWDAHYKLGQSVALAAIDRCIELADVHGVGQVSVDCAFHYLWGGGYVMRAAKRGYIAYTNCTASLTEVVPHLGRTPTLGTNPHSWGFPTQAALGFPIVIDWATSSIAWGKVTHCQREGQSLPAGAALDADGEPTTDPSKAKALLPFGGHKGYGLGLLNEIVSAFIGGSLPTVRNRGPIEGEKHTATFFFQVIHPEALNAQNFAGNRSQLKNVGAVIRDILGHGNENAKLPGQVEADAAATSARNGGLLFSRAEILELSALATAAGLEPISIAELKVAH